MCQGSPEVALAQLEAAIEGTMLADRFRLRRMLRAIGAARRRGQAADRLLEQFHRLVEESAAEYSSRLRNLPRPRWQNDLPVTLRRQEIAQAIREHPVVVVCGETGSGKSTQLPQICLELGRGVAGMIGHTQPRRIAARSIAARIAAELGVALGQEVGYKVRFTDATSPRTYVKLMTDGILLAETQGDRFLERYDTIILDEAHERSLNIDFLLGYLRNLLAKRRDLKLIITSATIDVARYAAHFAVNGVPAPVIEVAGRTWPVEIRWRPPAVDEATGEPDLQQAVLDAVDEVARQTPGDLLVFMPTEQAIHETAKALRSHRIPGDDPEHPTEILPLYARLPVAEQQRVFEPHSGRRIVIATNVAESSLTVPGIRGVIDPGTARISRYSARSKTQRLPIEPISQASADQRAGRCGRVGPGICIRLYSAEDYEARPRYTPPEILRTNLAWVILQTKVLGLGAVERFPFLDPPRPEAVRDGYRTLFELGALDEREELTELGRRLARIPVDPRLGRMILAAEEHRCLHEVLIIAAALAVQDPRWRPADRLAAADAAHARFADPDSDFLTYIRLWEFYQELKQTSGRHRLRRACQENFLSYTRMREWQDIHRQLLEIAEQAGLKLGPWCNDYAAIHRAILAGLLSNVALRTDAHQYTAAGGRKFYLWPGSTLFTKKPRWIVAAEMVQTNRRYLRTCAHIQPRWIEPLAGPLVKRFYSEPHWDRRWQAPAAWEKVTLFGLPIVEARKVRLGEVDPAAAREVLIQAGLVEGRLEVQLDFLEHNRRLLEELGRWQNKMRRPDLLLGQWAQYDFYDRRLPPTVYDARGLVRWYRRHARTDPAALRMRPEDLLRDGAPALDPADFPEVLNLDGLELPVRYAFDPGAEDDGVTITVPVEAVSRLDPSRLEWLVPGLLARKVEALIRSLPKPLRRHLVPVPETAQRVAEGLRFGHGSLLDAVAQALSKLAGQRIVPHDFQRDKLPRELQMNICVVDAAGHVLAQSRDLGELRQRLAQEAQRRFATLDDRAWRRDGMVDWDFDELPEVVHLDQAGLVIAAFPMLVDQQRAVGLRLAPSAEKAARHTRAGLRRLVVLRAGTTLRPAIEWLPCAAPLRRMAEALGSLAGFSGNAPSEAPQTPRDLLAELVELVADRAFLTEPIPRTKAQFEAFLEAGRQRIGVAVQEVAELMPPLCQAFHEAWQALQQARNAPWQYAVSDITGQLARLMPPGFLVQTPWHWLRQFPRYCRAMAVRLERIAAGGLARDRRAWEEEILPREEACGQCLEQHRMMDTEDPELILYRWMLEEYRVSLFAQRLGTALPVSGLRLDRQWAKIQR